MVFDISGKPPLDDRVGVIEPLSFTTLYPIH
jgi:hypothetical protein